MRPVQRRRSIKQIHRYGDSKDLLTFRLGNYCSYCERPTAYAIEHVLPWGAKNVGTRAVPILQPQHPRLQNSWTNFLLTCVNCNLFKKARQDATPYGHRRQARTRYYWPDADNTFRAFAYFRTGDVVAHPSLLGPKAAKASGTLTMLGFDTPGDARTRRRADAWTCAEQHLGSWASAPTSGNLDLIALSARLAGQWSIWRTVFASHPRVLARLNQEFPGTDRPCFDPQTGAPIARRKGQL